MKDFVRQYPVWSVFILFVVLGALIYCARLLTLLVSGEKERKAQIEQERGRWQEARLARAFTVPQAAQRIGLGTSRTRTLIRKGILPATKIERAGFPGYEYRITPEDIARYEVRVRRILRTGK